MRTESMLYLVPVFFVFATLLRNILRCLIRVYILLCYKGVVDIYLYLFIHPSIHSLEISDWSPNRNHSYALWRLYFAFYVLTFANLHGFDRRSFTYDHQVRSTSQIVRVDDSVLWCCHSEFMATNASPGMMNIGAQVHVLTHDTITSQR